jgi:hypothetical protein
MHRYGRLCSYYVLDDDGNIGLSGSYATVKRKENFTALAYPCAEHLVVGGILLFPVVPIVSSAYPSRACPKSIGSTPDS